MNESLPANPMPPVTAPAISRPPRRWLLPAGMAIVAAVVVATHWPAVHSPIITFDDEQYLLDNVLVQRPGWDSARQFFTEVLHPSTVHGYYQPLAMISLMIDWSLGGSIDNLRPFHATSLALHAANTCLVILLLYRLFGRPGVATLGGLLFGLHPITIEAVPWIAERKTLLGSFFALASLCAYVRYARCPRRRTLLWSAALFVLAMLSKPTTTPLPAIMLLLDIWPLGRFGRRAILEKVPLLALSACFAVITYLSQRNTATIVLPSQHGPLHVPFVLCHNIVFYLFNIFCPTRLTWYYAYPLPFTWESGWVRAGVIGTVALLAGLALSLRWTRAFAVGWLLFFVAIFPTLGIIGFTPVIAADRHAYLPLIGLLILLAWVMTAALERAGRRRGGISIAGGLTIVLLAGCLAMMTRHYYTRWQDNIGFRKYLISRAPQDWPLRNSLAMAYARAGRLDDALAEFAEAGRTGSPDTFGLVNWGLVLQKKGRIDEAIERYERALKIDNALPEAHNNLGEALAQSGRGEEARRHFDEALRLKPLFAEAWCNKGNLLRREKHYAEAIAAYQRGLELKPYLDVAARNMAVAQRDAGDTAAAERTLRALVRGRPGSAEAHSELGGLLRDTGRPAEAMEHVRKALALDPQSAAAHYQMANLLIDAKDYDKAAESLRAALRIDERFVDARINLANLLAAQGRADEAMVEYRAAIRDEPGKASAYNNLAAILEERGDFAEAERNYREAIRADAAYVDPHYNYAGLLVRMNKLEAALAELEAALRLAPKHVPAAFLKANILVHLGKTGEALSAYDAVLAIDPSHAEARQQREALAAAAGRP